MRRFSLLTAFVAAVLHVFGATSMVAEDLDDYIVAEREYVKSNPSGLGATVSSGTTLVPLRVHHVSQVSSEEARSLAVGVVSQLNSKLVLEGVPARFVLTEVTPWTGTTTGRSADDLSTYAASTPYDGAFALLMLTQSDRAGLAFLNEGPPSQGMRLRAVMGVESWLARTHEEERVFLEQFTNTYAHEGGHNTGLKHPLECFGPAYNCGFVTTGGLGDVMSPSGSQVGRYSSPTTVINGEVLGDENADAVRYMRDWFLAARPFLKAVVEPCVNEQGTLGLQGGRFLIDVCWRIPSQNREGIGTGVQQTPDTGYFWFFSQSNIELVVKVLDGTASNGHYWVFYGALTNVEYTLTVTDAVTGWSKTYHNSSGTMASFADVSALPAEPPSP